MDRAWIDNLVRTRLQDTDYELITLDINPDNEILIEVDRLEGVDVDFCASLNSYLIEQLDAAGIEDYALEVGSVSLTDPFRCRMQYQKHLGHDVEVLTPEGKKLRGQLVSVDEDTFAIEVDTLVAVEGKKRKQHTLITHTFPYDGVQYTRYDLQF